MAQAPSKSSAKAKQTKQGPHDRSDGQATKPTAAKPKTATRAKPPTKAATPRKPGGAAALEPKKRKMPSPAQDALTAADAERPIHERIASGQTYRQIASSVGVSMGVFAFWIDATPERSQACARAREIAAQFFDEQAEARIDEAEDMFELSKAKEIATHLRWRAKAANPKRYGDRTTVQGDPDAPPIQHNLAVRFVNADAK